MTVIHEGCTWSHLASIGELMAILEEAVAHPRLSAAEVLKVVRDLGLITGDEGVATIRADRDAR